MCAHLLVVRDLSYQHFGNLPGHVAVIIHFSLPENSDICPDPVTARPRLPHLTCTLPHPPPSNLALDQMAFSHLPPPDFTSLPPSSLSHILLNKQILNQKAKKPWSNMEEPRTLALPTSALCQEKATEGRSLLGPSGPR